MKYFSGIKTTDEAHKTYKEWAKKLHPDNHQTEPERSEAHEAFTAMKNEYEQLVTMLTTPKRSTEQNAAKLEKKMRKKMNVKLTKAHKEKITSTGSKFVGAVAEGFAHSVIGKVLEKIETAQ